MIARFAAGRPGPWELLAGAMPAALGRFGAAGRAAPPSSRPAAPAHEAAPLRRPAFRGRHWYPRRSPDADPRDRALLYLYPGICD